ncbi:unnamed protein product [Allacma fusca]|uniref:Uncharacterized protein n=1 Tax=Allacma fusca TaxID=39272 RepID=A0A8J2L760_9HEXA|nr:unnamed protein product [Allacma fusca]
MISNLLHGSVIYNKIFSMNMNTDGDCGNEAGAATISTRERFSEITNVPDQFSSSTTSSISGNQFPKRSGVWFPSKGSDTNTDTDTEPGVAFGIFAGEQLAEETFFSIYCRTSPGHKVLVIFIIIIITIVRLPPPSMCGFGSDPVDVRADIKLITQPYTFFQLFEKIRSSK